MIGFKFPTARAVALGMGLWGGIAWADPAADLGAAWRAALTPAAQHGQVVLSSEVELEHCTLSYHFLSKGGTVTDTIILPLAALDIQASRSQSTFGRPTETGLTFMLRPGEQGEQVKTWSGPPRRRATNYGPIFPEHLSSDEAALRLLEQVLEIAADCDANS